LGKNVKKEAKKKKEKCQGKTIKRKMEARGVWGIVRNGRECTGV
jgi:hypothetical protein